MSMTVVKFLAARVSEEQAMAEGAASGPHDDALDRDDFGRLLIRPDRVLAQVAAMRAIVDQYERLDRESDKSDGLADLAAKVAAAATARDAVRHLAAIWADHDDYDPAWAVDT